jgi:hypothetical protein
VLQSLVLKKLVLIRTLFWLGILAQAQVYTPMLSTTNHWYLTSCFDGCLQDYYFAVDDTLVNGMNHKILDGYHYISRTFLLREEVTEKKVFLTKISPNRIDEYLLYDFSLEEGDEFEMKNPITPFVSNGGLYILDSIRMKPIFENTSRKHFYFSPHPVNTQTVEFPVWVEGSGSLSMINAPGGTPDFMGAGFLQCHFKDDEVFYRVFAEDESCDVNILSVSNFPEPKTTPQIANVNDGIWVRFDHTLNLHSLSILNLQGQLLQQIQMQDIYEFFIPLHHFSRGIYVLFWEQSNKRGAIKFLY